MGVFTRILILSARPPHLVAEVAGGQEYITYPIILKTVSIVWVLPLQSHSEIPKDWGLLRLVTFKCGLLHR